MRSLQDVIVKWRTDNVKSFIQNELHKLNNLYFLIKILAKRSPAAGAAGLLYLDLCDALKNAVQLHYKLYSVACQC